MAIITSENETSTERWNDLSKATQQESRGDKKVLSDVGDSGVQ
jgi:hypothetical protein